MNDTRSWRDFDWILFGSILALALVGVIFIWSTNLALEGDARTYDRSDFKKQIMWLGISLAAFLATLLVDYRFLRRAAYPLYALVLGSLAALFLLGGVTRHARRWFSIAGLVSIQPSEFMKIALILALARCLMFPRSIKTLRGLLVPALLTVAPIMLILMQPDLGTALMLPVALVATLFIAGARARHVAPVLVMSCALVAGTLLACYFFDARTVAQKSRGLLRPYQVRRIQGFLKPEEHPKESYQYRQSLLAIGSGGLVGKGWGQGTQNRLNFLPEGTTDFIFAVVGEERGFLGVLLVLALFCTIVVRSMRIARRTREPFGRLIVVGAVTVFAAQALVNVAMTVGLVPISGITLPLVSYGGSSLLATSLSLALVMNVGMRRVVVMAGEDFT